jgi:hypothetical protein
VCANLLPSLIPAALNTDNALRTQATANSKAHVSWR